MKYVKIKHRSSGLQVNVIQIPGDLNNFEEYGVFMEMITCKLIINRNMDRRILGKII